MTDVETVFTYWYSFLGSRVACEELMFLQDQLQQWSGLEMQAAAWTSTWKFQNIIPFFCDYNKCLPG